MISSNFGASFGTSALLLDGSWKDLASFIRDCTSGFSAQSYQALALSRFLAPRMIDIEPIS
ncbi:hypothetical protein D3C71_2153690 [compost metagenome]